MKNLKMFAIAVMAFAVMATGVHAATDINTLYAAACNETSVTNKCTLKTNLTISADYDVNDDVTIVTSGTYSLVINASQTLKVADGVTLTVDGGNVQLSGTLDIGEDAVVRVINSNKVPAINVPGSATGTITALRSGTLEVSDNDHTTAIVVNTGSTLNITLDNDSTLNVSNNKGNGMNGVGATGLIQATDSHIIFENNGSCGGNGKFRLINTDIVAKGNGLAGVTLAESTVIDAKSTVTSTGNLQDTDNEKLGDFSDVLINTNSGNVTVRGTLTAGSMTPLKSSWNGQAGTVKTGNLKLDGENALVSVAKFPVVCTGSAIGGGCVAASQNKINLDPTSTGTVVEGNDATVYGDAEVTLGGDVKTVTIKNSAAKVTIAPGTEVVNDTKTTVYVTLADGTIKSVEKGKTVTLGEPVNSGDQTNPGDQNTGDNANTPADGTTGRLPDEPAKTNDNILVYAGLGLVSALAVSFSTKRKENN